MKLLLCLNVLYIVSLLNSSLYLNKNIISSSLDNNKTIIKSRKEIGEDEEYISLLRNNYQKLIDAYNEASKDKLLATELLVCRKMNNEDDLYYLGFDKGFAIVDSNKTVVEVTNRDYTYKDDLNDYDEIFYRGNTFYYKKDNELIELIDDRVYTIKTSSAEGSQSNGVSHNGQIRPGDGTIYDLDDYIDDRYANPENGPSFTLTPLFSCYIQNFKYVYQLDTSFYLTAQGISEGNCTLNATFSMLSNMGLNGHGQGFYNSDSYIDVTPFMSLDPHCYLTMDLGWIQNDNNRVASILHGDNCLQNMSLLYKTIRSYAIINQYDESVGFSPSYMPAFINEIDANYNCQMTTVITSSGDDVRDSIDLDIPCLISAHGSETYHNHTMAVRGYSVYLRQLNGGLFNFSIPKTFYAIDDGWYLNGEHGYGLDSTIKYFDPDFSDTISFVCVDGNVIDLSNC